MTSLICLKCNEEFLNLHAAEMHDCSSTEVKLIDNADKIKKESFHADQAFDNDQRGFNGTSTVSIEINAQMYGANTFQSYGSPSWLLNKQSSSEHRDKKILFENYIRNPEKITDRDSLNFESFPRSHLELHENRTEINPSENSRMPEYFPENVESIDRLTAVSNNIQSYVNDQNVYNSFSRQTFSNEQSNGHNECSVSNPTFVELKQNGGNEDQFKNSDIDREQVSASDYRFDMQNFNFPFTGITLANSKTTKTSTTFHKGQNSTMSDRNNLFPSHKTFDGINSNSNIFSEQEKINNDYSSSSTSQTGAKKCEKHLCKAKFRTESYLAVHCDTVLKGDHTSLGQKWDEGVEKEASIHSDVSGSKRDMYNKELGTENSLTKNSQGPSVVKSYQSDQCSPKDCNSVNGKKPSRRRLYHCNECKGIIDEAHLIEHKRLHTEEKILKGDECHEMLKIQDLTKSSPLSKNACSECSKRFLCTKNLRRHTRLHTGEKPYECNECHWAFNQKNNLTSHKRLHTITKPFDCPKCLKKYTRRDTLKKHKCI
ncbi:zinc finger protein 16 [Trichonephila clavata]|uniref:Zinc finger protein 16 n=1 Tax=Trichonephila clavata TaxID=2740835 RepID=A0A8X6KT36_TRICU|nr:zinc finger protein 16 [Trichonephila clavata]